MAYAHELSFMLCFAALTAERFLIRANPDRSTATKLIITDVVYGLAALTLLGSGVLRVLYFGQGPDFYTENPLFWWKVGIYLSAGSLLLYPTCTYAVSYTHTTRPTNRDGKIDVVSGSVKKNYLREIRFFKKK